MIRGADATFCCRSEVGPGASRIPSWRAFSLQNFELLQNCAIPKETAEKIQTIYLNDLTPKLLRLSQIYGKLRTDIEAKAAGYKPPGKGATAVVLPQIMQLEEECRNYLYEAKNFLRDLLKVFNLLFGANFDEASEWTTGKKPKPSVVGFAETNFQSQPDHIRYLQQLPQLHRTLRQDAKRCGASGRLQR